MCGGVALDRLRSSALIHLAALQLRRPPAWASTPAVLIKDTNGGSRAPEQRQDQFRAALALAGRSITSVTPAPEVTVNFMARSPMHRGRRRRPLNAPKETPRQREFRRGAVVNRSLEDERQHDKFALTALARSIEKKVEGRESAAV